MKYGPGYDVIGACRCYGDLEGVFTRKQSHHLATHEHLFPRALWLSVGAFDIASGLNCLSVPEYALRICLIVVFQICAN
jgi:hypothetical protein